MHFQLENALNSLDLVHSTIEDKGAYHGLELGNGVAMES